MIIVFNSQKILTHSRSRVVLLAMKHAMANNKIFHVYVTHSAPNNSGYTLIFIL